MDIKTHHKIDNSLCGQPVLMEDKRSEVRLETLRLMQADDKGLVHGGFIFGLADYAAMLAVNHPNVVLGNTQAKFLKPVNVGDVLLAKAQVLADVGKKRNVQVDVFLGETKVFTGEFVCFVLEQHVLGSLS